MWVWIIVLVAIIGVIAVLAAGRDETMVEVYDDRPDATLPTGRPLTAEDLAAVRFSTAVRGYRMDEVDALLTRVQADLLAREPAARPVEEFESGGLDGLDLQESGGLDGLDLQDDEPPSGASAARPSS